MPSLHSVIAYEVLGTRKQRHLLTLRLFYSRDTPWSQRNCCIGVIFLFHCNGFAATMTEFIDIRSTNHTNSIARRWAQYKTDSIDLLVCRVGEWNVADGECFILVQWTRNRTMAKRLFPYASPAGGRNMYD